MPGIYIHIPFCKQACHYCDFHFSTSLRTKEEMITAICEEAGYRKNYLEGKTVETLYFGGGTPGILEGEEIKQLMGEIKKIFPLSVDAEITLETNPDDVTEEKLAKWNEAGINRLSIGIQTFTDKHLRQLNRAHDSKQATEAVTKAQKAGFGNITIDLIYGIPGEEISFWKKNLKKAFSLGVQHISAYCLTVEKGTALHHFVTKGTFVVMDEEKISEQFLLMQEEMDKHGFIAYEISNYGKKGYFSRHNTSYWKGEQYLGLGPSAHSFNGISRQWNISNNKKYTEAVLTGNEFWESEQLTGKNQFNEYLMTGLRTIWGVNEKKIESFGTDALQHFKTKSAKYLEERTLVKNQEGNYVLAATGKLFADRIASDLFLL